MIDKSIRSDFPLLSQNKELIYFDNSCMSLRPDSVIKAIERYYTDFSACAGRSNHRLARQVSDAVEEARKAIQQFIKAKKEEEIIFTRNTSEAINLVAQSLHLKKGDIVLTSDKEHNSNLVPWLTLVKKLGIVHKIIPSKEDNTFDLSAFEKMLSSEVRLVSVVQTSNLDGVTFPIDKITKLAHKHGSLVMIDGAQSVPHTPTDVVKSDIDFLAFSGHKMCGPSGTGILYGKYKLLEKLEGFMVGGDTVVDTTYTTFELLKPPEKFEAGLQDYAGIMGLQAAVEYINKVGMDEIHKHEMELNKTLTALLDDEERIMLIGPHAAIMRGGIYSFYIEGVDPHQVALMLDESGTIMVRSGQHCVHSWFNARNLAGSVRASFYYYNTLDEVEIFADKLISIITVIT